MNVKQLVAVSTIVGGLLCSSAYAQDPQLAPNGMASHPILLAEGASSSGSSNSGTFGSTPDLNSPGGTKDAGKGSGGNVNNEKDRQGMGSGMGSGSSGSSMDKSASGASGDKGKSATGQPAAAGPQGEDKAAGGGPSGPQALPPGKAPRVEDGTKGK